MNAFELEKFKNLFIDECSMLLDKLEKELLSLEETPDDTHLLESVFRAMHTIKGTSGMYGFKYINEFTHILENIYQLLRDGKTTFTKEISNVSLQATDHIRNLLNDENLSDQSNQEQHKSLLEKISNLNIATIQQPSKKVDKTKKADKKEPSSWLILLHTDEQISFRGVNIMNIFEELATLGTYTIKRITETLIPNSQSWLVFLNTLATKEEIEDVFLFIDDNVKITKLDSKPLTKDILNEASLSQNTIHELLQKQHESRSIAHPEVHMEEHKESRKPSKGSTKRILVDSEKLDYLMYLVSELVTINSNLIQDGHRLKDGLFFEHLEKHSDLANLFRHSVLDLRLIPLSDMALRFQRLIRDLSSKLDKKIEFKTEGIDIELDKNTIDGLSESLMHIIRNCIDHGIEKPEKRKSIGKPESGCITLSVVQGGSFVYIHVKDDGGGINRDIVKSKAIEKGILRPTDEPSDRELFDIIFLPGFSTAQSLTDVSGRGVGMDVVKQEIGNLRGEIIISSQDGVGTTFTLKIPQSLNIIDSLHFSIAENDFIVPLLDVQECNQISLSDLRDRKNTGTIPYNNQLIPFIDLRQHLNLNGEYNKKVKTVILNSSNKLVAIMVDKIIGEHHAVIRQITKKAKVLPIFNASSQLGNGKTALMIDTTILTSYYTN